jgi:hypothetical protein
MRRKNALSPPPVTPAKAGAQPLPLHFLEITHNGERRVPAFAGTTSVGVARQSCSLATQANLFAASAAPTESNQSQVKSSAPTARHCGGKPFLRQYATTPWSASLRFICGELRQSGGSRSQVMIWVLSLSSVATTPS